MAVLTTQESLISHSFTRSPHARVTPDQAGQLQNNKPWLMVEVKLSNPTVNQQIATKFMKYFKCPYIQVVNEPNIYRQIDNTIVMSSDLFLKGLP